MPDEYEPEYITEEGKPKKKGFFKRAKERVTGSYGYGKIKEYKEKAPERRETRMARLKEDIEELKLKKEETKLREQRRKLKGKGMFSGFEGFGGGKMKMSLSGKMPSFAPTGKAMPQIGGGGIGRGVPQVGGMFGSPFGQSRKKRRKKKRR